ncbi:Ldh family oxidoreductase [Rhizobium sp. TRM96647]|uniref:Ldh family oxidoreductase n=1 Tax=unclassified Rhizobium TaxID=2613769 RepID=UPI0021E73A78|nr:MULTISPECIES: Ldh family oxidoreductase [unclassified Rhizobium]MCV3738121.1 Ldh family oxidoreductase [Rhizobium sp. TRM96647]MCV3759808.1 Ldh family oxidoreductase [Rhizobium sp. TRM96650]
MADRTISLTLAEVSTLAAGTLVRAGASEALARSLARAIVAAEAAGKPALGLAHLPDYLDALDCGRIDGRAEPLLTSPVPALTRCDCRGGIAQLGFDTAFEELVSKTRIFGLTVYASHNSFTAGELGWYVARLAAEGLVAFAATNGPALLAGAGSVKPVYCTNPLAFAAPRANGPPLVIDQASSATAFVKVREAAERGKTIPEGWALDAAGRPTTDPNAAIKGALVAFGGARGANIALMVEVLAAGLTGANWSLDAPDFQSGDETPGAGLFVLAIAPQFLARDFETRLARQLERLSADYGVHIPGEARARARRRTGGNGITLPLALFDSISSFRRR